MIIASVSCSAHSEWDIASSPTSTFFYPIRELPTVLPPGDAWLAIPPSVQDAHRTSILLITWHEQPYPGYYNAINLRNDGRLRHGVATLQQWDVGVIGSSQESYPAGQLTQQEMTKVQGFLEKLTTADMGVHDNEVTIVSLSFVWQGEHHFAAFDQNHCARAVIQLFELIDAVFSRHPDVSNRSLNPCRAPTGTEGIFTPGPTFPAVNFTRSDLPKVVQRPHRGLPLVKVVWFQKPFDDSYHQIKVLDDHKIVYRWQLSDEQRYHRVIEGELTDAQMQTLRDRISKLSTEESSDISSATTVIAFGYGWQGDYDLRLFTETDYPNDLEWLFLVAEEILGFNIDLRLCQD